MGTGVMVPLRKLVAKYPVDEILECCASNFIRPKVLIRQLQFNPRKLTEEEWESWKLDRERFPGFLHHLGYGSMIAPIPEKLIELPVSIWVELAATPLLGSLNFKVAVVDEELRQTWRLPPFMETVPFEPSITIQLNSLSPLLLSKSDLDTLEPYLELADQYSYSSPGPEKELVQRDLRKPHSAFIKEQILGGCQQWKESWAEFLKLANGKWRDISGFYCQLTPHVKTVGKETVKVETDCGQSYVLTADSFRMAFSRHLKKSEH